MDEIEKLIAKWRAERIAKRKSERPLRQECASEIRDRIIEVLKESAEQAKADRRYGVAATHVWYSVGSMTQLLRITSRSITGTLFHEFSKSDQRLIVRGVLESLKREGIADRAIGYENGRECKQYSFAEGDQE